VQVLRDCKVRLNATCVSSPVDRYEWVLDTQDRFETVNVPDGPAVLDHTWDDDDCDEDGSTITFRLTVHRGAATSTATKSLFVPGEDDLKESSALRELPLRMTVLLELPASRENARAGISVDGLASPRLVSSGEPIELRFEGAVGTREVTATVWGVGSEPGNIQIDLNATLEVVPGSLRATQGVVLTQGPRTVTFRLAGRPGESVRFTFELRE
jgi:hypothetical protein